MIIRSDPYHAFLDYGDHRVSSADEGPLKGLTFAVKDIFDVAGYPTGCGNPVKLAESGVKSQTAPVVQRLLDTGGEFVGKTQTDELAFSLTGYNKHYPRPLNPHDPERVTGGSSAGSAAATAAELCDFAIGSDTGGSVRAPGSFCGLWGIRPTHGRVPLDRVMPLASSFDVAGYFAKTAEIFRRVAEPFLGADSRPFRFSRLLRARDCFAYLDAETADALAGAEAVIAAELGSPKEVEGAPVPLREGYEAFRCLQAQEAWAAHGEWIAARDPDMIAGVRERFEFGATVTEDMSAAAKELRSRYRDRIGDLLGDDGLLMLPSVPTIAPKAAMSDAEMATFRDTTLPLLCLSGHSQRPQVTIPVAKFNGMPIGLGLIGPLGSDVALIKFASTLQLKIID